MPPASDPRVNYLETDEARRLADAQPEPYRTLSALLAGTGMDVNTALELRRRDVDVETREIRARGTKTYTRDRVIRVAEWAWPYLAQRLTAKLPDARLLDGIPDRWVARKDAVLVHRVYGRFSPKQEERDKWERIAAERDQTKRTRNAKHA